MGLGTTANRQRDQEPPGQEVEGRGSHAERNVRLHRSLRAAILRLDRRAGSLGRPPRPSKTRAVASATPKARVLRVDPKGSAGPRSLRHNPSRTAKELTQSCPIGRGEGQATLPHSQKPLPMALAAQRLSEAISERRIRHRGDPDLTRHVVAASPKPVGEGWRFVKPKLRTGVIDGAIALAMAVSIAGDIQPKEALIAFT
jgi:hypothetical protein